tara:strand:+ start:1674 stop:1835 length:162 start_codon:yes stop_codon:yes gene_type:complete
MSKFVDDGIPAFLENIVQVYRMEAAWSVIQRFDAGCSVCHGGVKGADLGGELG